MSHKIKHSILIAFHNSLGIIKTYVPHLLSLLDKEQEVLLLDLCSQDSPYDFLFRYIPEIQSYIDSGTLRTYRCVGDVQVNPAQGFNALSKYANGDILTFLSANQFAPTPDTIYDIVRDGRAAYPKFNAQTYSLGGLKLSITAKDFAQQMGFYEKYSTFEFLQCNPFKIANQFYIDIHPPICLLPKTLGNIQEDISHFFSLQAIGVTPKNSEMGMARILEVG